MRKAQSQQSQQSGHRPRQGDELAAHAKFSKGEHWFQAKSIVRLFQPVSCSLCGQVDGQPAQEQNLNIRSMKGDTCPISISGHFGSRKDSSELSGILQDTLKISSLVTDVVRVNGNNPSHERRSNRIEASNEQSLSSRSIFPLLDMPEDCLKEILRNLPAVDLCQVAVSCKLLHSAALTDEILADKMPKGYEEVLPGLKHSDGDAAQPTSKSQLLGMLASGVMCSDGEAQQYWFNPVLQNITLSISVMRSVGKTVSIWRQGHLMNWGRVLNIAGAHFPIVVCLKDTGNYHIEGQSFKIACRLPQGQYLVSWRMASQIADKPVLISADATVILPTPHSPSKLHRSFDMRIASEGRWFELEIGVISLNCVKDGDGLCAVEMGVDLSSEGTRPSQLFLLTPCFCAHSAPANGLILVDIS
eukprot:TRINITY_DN1583_c0_g1_i5.p1 TRINITY_DN1583_c0_g1~~TRINITY_DN1583_c0_g1_i5.p1  ORF type:complete len:416 (+),score=40.70 TRINITY_DN1583_c0_g1_i5:105-1352(+)